MHSPSVDLPPRPRTRRGAAWAAGLLALCSAVLLALVAAGWPPLLSLDRHLADTTHRWAVTEHGVTRAFRILTDWVWDPWTMRLVCALAAGWLVWRRADRWTAGWLAVTCVLGSLLQQALKAAVGRPRPVWPDPVDSAHYAAFPSGHAMTAVVVCGLLLSLLPRGGARWPAALALCAVSVAGVGVTRVWLGVHWASDVLGGWLLGALTVALALLVRWRHRPSGNGAGDS
jgi:membrane-associated phospholipid phosphatase